MTKSLSGFRILSDPNIFLVDSPGIITPRIKTPEEGLKLCACHSIRDGIEETELVCDYILFTLNKQKQFAYVKRYDLRLPSDEIGIVLMAA